MDGPITVVIISVASYEVSNTDVITVRQNVITDIRRNSNTTNNDNM